MLEYELSEICILMFSAPRPSQPTMSVLPHLTLIIWTALPKPVRSQIREDHLQPVGSCRSCFLVRFRADYALKALCAPYVVRIRRDEGAILLNNAKAGRSLVMESRGTVVSCFRRLFERCVQSDSLHSMSDISVPEISKLRFLRITWK